MSAVPIAASSPPPRVDGFGVVPGIIWAFRIHEDGTAEALPVDKPIENRHDGWLWLHLNLTDMRAVNWAQTARLPESATALLASNCVHQQIHAEEDCIYGVFVDFVQGIDGCGDDFAHLHFVMTERLLISARHHPISSVASVRQAIERGGRRLRSVASLLELIVEHVADAMDRLTDQLETEIDQIEDNLALHTHDVERPKLARARRTAVKMHRQLSGLRILFHRFERESPEGLKPELRFAAGRLAQRLDALDHEILALRERARFLQDEVVRLAGEVTNRHLYVLSILTTLILPPTLVTGIFGMNTKGLPFTDNESGFLLAAALMAASAVAVYLLMRRVGVFKL